jgi:hypothetical protein
VSLSARNPDRWTIDGESPPKKSELVERVGRKILSRSVKPSSHYRMPPSVVHGSLGASLGRFVPIHDLANVHTMFCIDVTSIMGWLPVLHDLGSATAHAS